MKRYDSDGAPQSSKSEGAIDRARKREIERESAREGETAREDFDLDHLGGPPIQLLIFAVSASERRGNNMKELKAFYLDAKARIRPRLFYVCHVHPIAAFNRWRYNLFKMMVVQGYLAHKKKPTPLRPPYDPRHRPTVGS